ncbi:MAG: hypothetical protein GTN78_19825 [Gemmatimonadales bacterium]|nr:hypothetical protein [Gemmatimonadales bacterium]NIN12623.1 hypothetical protein [Gemmatimonadales bacterium]NIR02416.1 hypothetical protein [Gemmatimonadales bacterium]NIS66207.1 hypothetical protein [Gemmatimonadales bacterium]
MSRAVAVVANQVFLGLPWRIIRRKYEKCRTKLKFVSPLSYAIVGSSGRQRAEDLLEVIKKRLLSSSYAIFDATGGNANVALEYGFAEAKGIDRALYLYTHAAAKKPSKDSPIIADLAGKRRNHYKRQDQLLQLLQANSKAHPYTRRFERAFDTGYERAERGRKRRDKALGLKIIHVLDGKEAVRRGEIVKALLRDPAKYDRDEIDAVIDRLRAKRLLAAGKTSRSRVAIR